MPQSKRFSREWYVRIDRTPRPRLTARRASKVDRKGQPYYIPGQVGDDSYSPWFVFEPERAFWLFSYSNYLCYTSCTVLLPASR